MLPSSLCFIDVETTGGTPIHNRIIEIGIIKVVDGKVTKKFKSLINPQQYLSPFIQQLTGINPQDLESAPRFEDIRKDILELLIDSVFVAHNVRFDYGFLRHEFKRCGISFTAKQLCTVKLARLLFPGFKSYNLDSIVANFGISCENRHRAMDDAKVLWDFYTHALKTVGEEKLHECINTVFKRPAVPLHINETLLDTLPESSGVYIFKGKNNMPLYIGKSINIRDRVLSHFSNDHLSATDMQLSVETQDIEFIETSGELGALLLESSMIKKEQPLYNRMLRYARKMTILRRSVNTDGFSSIEMTEVDEISASDTGSILGVFRSRKQVSDFLYEVARENSLCLKLLGLEKTSKNCFAYHLGRCKGACIGSEMPIMYNIRFEQAFYAHKIKPWLFNGPVMVKEDNQGYIVDKWCLLGKIDESSEGDISQEYIFDVDTYKILKRFMLNKNNKHKISSFKNFNSH